MMMSEWLKRLRLLIGNTSPVTVLVVVSEGPYKQQLEMKLNKPQQERLKNYCILIWSKNIERNKAADVSRQDGWFCKTYEINPYDRYDKM
jgi:hypothetical protein